MKRSSILIILAAVFALSAIVAAPGASACTWICVIAEHPWGQEEFLCLSYPEDNFYSICVETLSGGCYVDFPCRDGYPVY